MQRNGAADIIKEENVSADLLVNISEIPLWGRLWAVDGGGRSVRQDFSATKTEELGKLFPVLLAAHDPLWKKRFEKETAFLQTVFGNAAARISHIGSTAVEGLIAKPTIDILLELYDDIDLPAITERMLDFGYVINAPPNDLIMFLKGYTPRGFSGQAFHIHVRKNGDWDELYFRDYLIANPETADEYAALKISLKEIFPNDRNGYTAAKGEFVKKYTQLARAEFGGRYQP